jgi:hypothetical protein
MRARIAGTRQEPALTPPSCIQSGTGRVSATISASATGPPGTSAVVPSAPVSASMAVVASVLATCTASGSSIASLTTWSQGIRSVP